MLLALLQGRAAVAAEIVDVATPFPSIDLLPSLSFGDTQERDMTVERPFSASGAKEFITLHGKGPGPVFRWAIAGIRNSGETPRQIVIAMPYQGFVGSGLFWPKPPGGHVVSITASPEIAVQQLSATGEEAYVITLEPGVSAAVAFEVGSRGLPEATLWQRNAFDAQRDYYAFFRGALLGVAALLVVAIFALYGFRSRPVFLAAGGFAAASGAFMMLEAGHLAPIVLGFGAPWLTLSLARAVIEGLMTAFLILYLVTGGELRRLMPVVGNLLLLLGGLAFAIPVYGFAEPLIASGIARVLFGVTVVAGFGLIFNLWRRGDAKAETALAAWSAIVLWTFIAVAAMLSDVRDVILSPLMLAGLCAVLVVMGFTLAHFAFSQGYLSRHFFREAGRRALALAGARAYVWDWQPEEGDLHVGEELERALGYQGGLLSEDGIEAFLELMHPADRAAYLAAVEAAEADGSGLIEREFRLRHGDGSYRWFQLRGRAMAGHGNRAVRCIGTLSDVTGAKRREERLLSDAVYDSVTGLPNRALFVDRVERAISGAEPPPGSDIYIVLMDIDRFKTFNDALGHEAGDALLSVIGRRLSVELDPQDSIARLPGDQFAILFAGGAGRRDVVAFGEDMRRAVARPINLDGQEMFLTASLGIAHHREPGLTAEQLLKDAAIALYEAKRRGVGSIEVFSTAMRDDRAELVVLEQELRRAIERNEIEVHYQPIARLADMNLAGFEALVRWRHPTLGLLAPESFIGLAEQTGMIRDIGYTVLNEAAHQLGIWQRAFRPAEPFFVAVNISSAQLIESDIIDDIKQILHREGVRRESLKIEVTESLVMQYPERAGHILERFRELGVGIACDDFGTGYSSLSSLRKLPFDTLKVDRSFIAADAQDQRSTVILDAIVAMAHALGLTIVAEGIENQDQVDRLGELGCDFGQGFFIGRPMAGRQVSEALAGLPYASGSGRTAITWLWERAAKEPPPELRTRDLTGEEIAESRRLKALEEEAEAQERARARLAMEAAARSREEAEARKLREQIAAAAAAKAAEAAAAAAAAAQVPPEPPPAREPVVEPVVERAVADVAPPTAAAEEVVPAPVPVVLEQPAAVAEAAAAVPQPVETTAEEPAPGEDDGDTDEAANGGDDVPVAAADQPTPRSRKTRKRRRRMQDEKAPV